MGIHVSHQFVRFQWFFSDFFWAHYTNCLSKYVRNSTSPQKGPIHWLFLLPKISEDHGQTLQQLMHLRKVYNCPISCQNTRNYLLFNATHSWYTQRFQTTIQWKNLSRLLLKMMYRPLVWVTKKLCLKIKSEFVALCRCTELRCQVSHVRWQRIPILNHCNQALQQEQCTFV